MEKYGDNLLNLAYKIPYNKRLELIDFIVNQILVGLEQIHRRGIIHGDLLISNIFCNYDENENTIECFIGDFSLSSVFDFNREDKKAILFPKDKRLTTKFDIWTLGLIIQHFLFKFNPSPNLRIINKKFLNPFDNKSIKQLNENVMKYSERFTYIRKKKRFGFDVKEPLSINYLDLYQKINSLIKNDEISYYLSHNSLFYSGMQSINHTVDRMIEKLDNYKLIDIICSLNQNKFSPDAIDIYSGHTFEYEKYTGRYKVQNCIIHIISDVDDHDFFKIEKGQLVSRYFINNMLDRQLTQIKKIDDPEKKINFTANIFNFIRKTNAVKVLNAKSYTLCIIDKYKSFKNESLFWNKLNPKTIQYFENLIEEY